jgi:hypothetical protein
MALLAACGAAPAASDEPTTAREKQQREARANGEDDGSQKNWGKWRYRGERGDCFYAVAGRCFKTERAACKAASCKRGQRCTRVGGGPVTVGCK